MVKGKNLEQGLGELLDALNSFVNIVEAYAVEQDKWNAKLVLLLQHSPFYAGSYSTRKRHIKLGLETLMKHAQDFHAQTLGPYRFLLAQWEDTYLKPNSAFYINSKNNKVN